MCYWDGSRSKQFYRAKQPVCLCHPGFTGHLCRDKEQCHHAITHTSAGPTVWVPTRVNATAFAVCPFGPRTTRLTRRCSIQERNGEKKPGWGLIDMSHSNQCLKKVYTSSLPLPGGSEPRCRYLKSTLLTKLALDSLVSLENFPLTAQRLYAFADKLDDILFTSYADDQVCAWIYSSAVLGMQICGL